MDLIDKTQLNECMTGEAELDKDLMQSFLEEITSRIAEMREACASDNHESWRANAHRSVGASATLGFCALAAAFRIAEHQVSNREERNAWLLNIDPLLDQSRVALNELGLL